MQLPDKADIVPLVRDEHVRHRSIVLHPDEFHKMGILEISEPTSRGGRKIRAAADVL